MQAASDFSDVFGRLRITVVRFVPTYDVVHQMLPVRVDESSLAHCEFGDHELREVTEMNLIAAQQQHQLASDVRQHMGME